AAPTTSGLTLYPTAAFTGLDESAKYSVPIAASGAAGITWTSSDPTIATVSGTDSVATITAVKAGTVTITAKAGTATATATITVESFKSADKATGQTAYATANCAGCHGASGPDISPSGVGKHTDAQLMACVTQGQNPEGGAVSIGAAAHSFAETTAIVAYLRSIPAAGVPKADQ